MLFCPLRFLQHPMLATQGHYVPNVNRRTRGDVLWAFSPPWTRAESLKGSGAPGHIVTVVHSAGGPEISQIIFHLQPICPVVWIIVLGNQSLLEKTGLHFLFLHSPLSECLKAFGDSTPVWMSTSTLSPTLSNCKIVSQCKYANLHFQDYFYTTCKHGEQGCIGRGIRPWNTSKKYLDHRMESFCPRDSLGCPAHPVSRDPGMRVFFF